MDGAGGREEELGRGRVSEGGGVGSAAAMDGAALPTGFRFSPTEDERVGFYLRNKLNRERPDMERFVPVLDVYSHEPAELPGRSGEASVRDGHEWFFFCPRQQAEAHGGRSSRTTRGGYWKATGSPVPVFHGDRVIGIKRTMVFYLGRAPGGRKTAWKMNEYRAAEEPSTSTADVRLRTEFSLCRVHRSSGHARSYDRRPVIAPAGDMPSLGPQRVSPAPLAGATSTPVPYVGSASAPGSGRTGGQDDAAAAVDGGDWDLDDLDLDFWSRSDGM